MVRWLGVLLLTLWSCQSETSSKVPPAIVGGTIDLAGWDFERDGALDLKGEWLFGWQRLVTPTSWSELENQLRSRIEVPGSWESFTHPTKPNENLPFVGYSTYALRLRGLNGRPLHFVSGRIGTAGLVQVLDLQGRVYSSGNAGVTSDGKSTSLPVAHVLIGTDGSVPVSSSDSMDDERVILMQVSNFHHHGGGLWSSPKIDNRASVKKSLAFEELRTHLMLGVLLIIGLYHLILFLLRRDDLGALFFGLFSLAVALRTSVMGVLQGLELARSVDGYQWLQSIEYASMPVMIMTSGLFLAALVPARFFEHFTRVWCLGAGIPLMMFALLTPPMTFAAYIQVYQLHILGGVLIILLHLMLQSVKGNTIARWCLLASCIVAVGSINDILNANRVIDTAYIMPFTTIGFVLMQAGILAARNAAIARERDVLNEVKMDALRKSEEAARVKSEFLANMSHELRTPLNALCNIPKALIGNFKEEFFWECPSCHAYFGDDEEPSEQPSAELCPDCPDTAMRIVPVIQYVGDQAEQHYFLNRLDMQAQKLLGLVDRVLSFGDASSDEMTLDISAVPSRALFGDIFVRHGLTALEKKQHLDVHYEMTTDEVLIDLEKVEQCIDAVLDNAFKFSGEGATVVCLVRAETADHLTVRVSDEGIGIPQDQFEKMFTAFYQVESSHTRVYGGAGLGLALAKQVADLHHGSIQVESTVDVGTTFTLHFRSTPS